MGERPLEATERPPARILTWIEETYDDMLTSDDVVPAIKGLVLGRPAPGQSLLGNVICSFRVRARMSVRQCSAESGVSRRHLQDIEHDRQPSVGELQALADILDISIVDLAWLTLHSFQPDFCRIIAKPHASISSIIQRLENSGPSDRRN